MYNIVMEYEWDEQKHEKNKANHNVDFSSIHRFDWDSAMWFEDTRFEYPEQRFVAYGGLDGRLHCVVYTCPDENTIRIISMRKANKREVIRYG